MAEAALGLLAIYLVAGLVIGIPFVLIGVGKVDPVAQTSPRRVRLLLLPGTVGLWPIMLAKWLRAGAAQDADRGGQA